MHFTEEANFQWIFEDLADSYTEIHFLYMKEAGKKKKKLHKPERELHKNCLQT